VAYGAVSKAVRPANVSAGDLRDATRSSFVGRSSDEPIG
jgi:hypothetical protein